MNLPVSLIPDWRAALEYASVRVGLLAAGLGLLPPDQQAAVLQWLGLTPERVPLALGLLFIASRILQRKDPQP